MTDQALPFAEDVDDTPEIEWDNELDDSLDNFDVDEDDDEPMTFDEALGTRAHHEAQSYVELDSHPDDDHALNAPTTDFKQPEDAT